MCSTACDCAVYVREITTGAQSRKGPDTGQPGCISPLAHYFRTVVSLSYVRCLEDRPEAFPIHAHEPGLRLPMSELSLCILMHLTRSSSPSSTSTSTSRYPRIKKIRALRSWAPRGRLHDSECLVPGCLFAGQTSRDNSSFITFSR